MQLDNLELIHSLFTGESHTREGGARSDGPLSPRKLSTAWRRRPRAPVRGARRSGSSAQSQNRVICGRQDQDDRAHRRGQNGQKARASSSSYQLAFELHLRRHERDRLDVAASRKSWRRLLGYQESHCRTHWLCEAHGRGTLSGTTGFSDEERPVSEHWARGARRVEARNYSLGGGHGRLPRGRRSLPGFGVRSSGPDHNQKVRYPSGTAAPFSLPWIPVVSARSL